MLNKIHSFGSDEIKKSIETLHISDPILTLSFISQATTHSSISAELWKFVPSRR